MLQQLFPERADNSYHGQKLAIVLFGLLLLMKTAISLGSIFNGRTAATSADGIPIDDYTPAGAQTVLSLFALLGVANLAICLIGILVLIRYRNLIPLMLVLFLLHQLSRKLVTQLIPIERVGAPPGGMINLVMLLVVVIAIGLSLWPRKNAAIA